MNTACGLYIAVYVGLYQERIATESAFLLRQRKQILTIDGVLCESRLDETLQCAADLVVQMLVHTRREIRFGGPGGTRSEAPSRG